MTTETNRTLPTDERALPWRLFKAGERSELPHIADATGRVIARAEGNIWVWQDFIAPVILAAVNDHDRLQLVFEEACNEVKMSHGKPCFCKYCHEPDKTHE
jgi:hypothetical protein